MKSSNYLIVAIIGIAGMATPVTVAAYENKTSSGQDSSIKPAVERTTGKQDRPELDLTRMPFDAESIRQVVKYHMPEIQECYEKVLADSEKKIEGLVFVNFVIDSNGNVSEAKALPKRSSLKDERVIDCILAMRRWYFPKPKDNRDHPVEYPFELKVKQ